MASCVPSPLHNYIMQRSVGSGDPADTRISGLPHARYCPPPLTDKVQIKLESIANITVCIFELDKYDALYFK